MSYYNIKVYEEHYSKDGLVSILDTKVMTGEYLHYWSILHDKDRDETNHLKKAHWHIVVETATNRQLTKIQKDWRSIESNSYIESVKNVCGVLQYLTHVNDIDKFQYCISEVISNDTDLELYKSLTMKTTKGGCYEMLLQQFADDMALLSASTNNNLNPSKIALQWFLGHNQLSYYVKHKNQLDAICSMLLSA